MRRLHGVSLPHAKQTAGSAFVPLAVPEKVLLPMSLHMGVPCTPTVKLKQEVTVGERIGTCDAPFSADIHASVSGVVTAITDYRPAGGKPCKAVEITSDGKQTPFPDLKVPEYSDRESFLAALRVSGAVGMGGAGLPTHIKLAPKGKIDYLLINAAECEPYITADDRTMKEKPLTILAGIRRIMAVLDIPECAIGVEKNKPDAMKILRDAADKDPHITLVPLAPVYPQGAEKVLIYHITGKVVPEGKLPADVGVIVMNVSSIAFLEEYFTTGMPFVNRGITVDGGLVKKPCSVVAPVGTPIRNILEYAECDFEHLGRLISGGPMMGMCLPSPDYPVTKTMNAILALPEAKPRRTTACIRCGRCIGACPMKLMPTELEKAYQRRDAAALDAYKLQLCMLCGCCSYVCPANRPLAESNSLAKAFVRGGGKK